MTLRACAACRYTHQRDGRLLETHRCLDCDVVLCFWCWANHSCTVTHWKERGYP